MFSLKRSLGGEVGEHLKKYKVDKRVCSSVKENTFIILKRYFLDLKNGVI